LTLQAIVDCVCKLYRCYQADPTGWEGVREIVLSLLSLDDLERYRIIFPDVGDLQDEWEEVVTNVGNYVNLLFGLLTNGNIRATRDKENHYDEEHWNGVTKNYYIAYHQLKVHLRWLATRPDEAAHYCRFQVSVFSICVATSKLNCNSSFSSVQLYYSQQAAERVAPGHPLGVDRYGQVGPIEMVGEGGGGDFPNVDAIAVGGDAAADFVKESRFSE
jgi:hypothetical protein